MDLKNVYPLWYWVLSSAMEGSKCNNMLSCLTWQIYQSDSSLYVLQTSCKPAHCSNVSCSENIWLVYFLGLGMFLKKNLLEDNAKIFIRTMFFLIERKNCTGKSCFFLNCRREGRLTGMAKWACHVTVAHFTKQNRVYSLQWWRRTANCS